MSAFRWLLLFAGLIRVLVDGAAAEVYGSSREQTLWLAAIQEQSELERQRSVLDHPELERYLGAIVGQLWEEVQSDLPWMQVRVLIDSAADAFAYPNGVCYLTSGMLSQTHSRDQLAMVIAHEMIHYTHRHALSAFMLGQSQPESQKRRDAQNALGTMAAEAERQADREGYLLMTRAGFCEAEALEILSRSHPSQGLSPGMMQFGGQGAGSPERGRDIAINDMRVPKTVPPECRIDSEAQHRHSKGIGPALIANAWQAFREGQWNLAADSIARYIRVSPDDPQGHFLKGELKNAGYTTAAVLDQEPPENAYQRAIVVDGDFAPAYQALGVVYFKKGQTAQAKEFFQRYLSLAPSGDTAAYIRRYLQLCEK